MNDHSNGRVTRPVGPFAALRNTAYQEGTPRRASPPDALLPGSFRTSNACLASAATGGLGARQTLPQTDGGCGGPPPKKGSYARRAPLRLELVSVRVLGGLGGYPPASGGITHPLTATGARVNHVRLIVPWRSRHDFHQGRTSGQWGRGGEDDAANGI